MKCNVIILVRKEFALRMQCKISDTYTYIYGVFRGGGGEKKGGRNLVSWDIVYTFAVANGKRCY